MKKLSTIVSATALALAFAAPVPSFARGHFAGPIIVMPDHSMSVKSMIGAPIYNDQHQKIGILENVMVTGSTTEPTAILSVGDYLGTGPKLVGVPLGHLTLQGKDAMMMAGATKSMLESLPIYSAAGG
ncbi:MAG TPA: PRC-barrel domain-containing protein [Acetobacteraceae bacterium]|nr:PRC-barrel domain-containing protein [Acetobacteraceae bacterium]